MIKLKNNTRMVQTLNLDPCGSAECGTPGGDCLCKTQTFNLATVDPKDGTKGVKEVEKRIPASVDILAGMTSDDLPDWVKDNPRVKEALRADRLRLVK